MTQLIGLSGVARAGKDAFCQYLIEELVSRGRTVRRFALADNLKRKIQQPLIDLCGIDPVTATGADKELIRPYMVEAARIKRIQSEGQYWTGLLEEEVKSYPELEYGIVTDIRYTVYPKDELWWLQKKMGGIFVHISRYNDVFLGGRQYVQPPNADEAKNDPILRDSADYRLQWSTASDLSKLKEHCLPYIKEFIDFIENKAIAGFPDNI